MDASTETIIVADDSCNDDDGATELDNLECIRIGMYRFGCSEEADYSFSVKNCSRLKELRIGPDSFGRWNFTEFENLPSLEVIQIGYMHSYDDYSFYSDSLELKSE